MKEDLSKEQLNRKIDEIYERLNHRMSYMESRIGNNIAKFQVPTKFTSFFHVLKTCFASERLR